MAPSVHPTACPLLGSFIGLIRPLLCATSLCCAVREALKIAGEYLSYCLVGIKHRFYYRLCVPLIPGRGNCSDGGEPKILPALTEWLETNGLQFEIDSNGGRALVFMDESTQLP